ncbi:MAG TPA: hypothetical protein VK498_13890 [Ferruginibacter sp.]|nr:hypothetical protein [Ferruginibacter sp.]
MARVTDKGIIGLVGSVVFYEMDGKNYVRSKPAKRVKKRNKKQLPVNNIFGTISMYGSGMIGDMKHGFLFPFKRGTYNSVRGWMYNEYSANYLKEHWDLDARNHSMCRLNESVDLRDFIKTGFEIKDTGSGKISISYPELNPANNFKAPPQTKKIKIKMIVVTSGFQNKLARRGFYKEEYNFNYKNEPMPAKDIVISTTAAPGDIAIVAIALEYATTDWQGDRYFTDLNCLPAAIVSMGRLK